MVLLSGRRAFMFDGHGAVGKGQISVFGVGQVLDSLALGNYPR